MLIKCKKYNLFKNSQYVLKTFVRKEMRRERERESNHKKWRNNDIRHLVARICRIVRFLFVSSL